MFKALMMLLVFIIFLAEYKVRNIDFMIYFLMSDLYIFHLPLYLVLHPL